MRAAVFSDVHGNIDALDAVLTDADTLGVDEYWILGDLVAHGPHPSATIQRLMGLANARFVRGNTDRYVITGELSAMMPKADLDLVIQASRSFAWTRGAVTAVGGYEWLASLPPERRVQLPDRTQLLLVHAAPGTDDGPGLYPDMTDAELRAGVADAEAELILVGHTHVPMDRTVSGVRVVNLGSVSLPITSERRAMWTLLTADADGFAVEPHFSEYDLGAVVSALDAQHHPSAEWLKGRVCGGGRPGA